MNTEKLKELLGAATPGPWDCDVFRGEDVSLESHGIELGMMFAGKNAALIVAAVNALPSLIARVDALRVALEGIKSRSAISVVMRDPYALAAELGSIHQIAAAALTTYDQEKARG